MGAADFLKDYFRDFSWVAAGMGGAMIVDFVFYILAGRLMDPIEFGYFGVITSLYYIFLRSPFSVIETVSRKIQAEDGDSLEVLGKKSLYLGFLMFGLFAAVSEPLASILSIPQKLILVFSLVFPAGYLLAAMVGKVQGDQRFEVYGRYEFLSSFISFSMIIPVYLGFGASAATAMFIVEIIAGAAVLARTELSELGNTGFDRFSLLKNSFAYVVGVHAAFSLDIIAVNYFFAGEVTGFYNTVAVLGKGLFFGAVAVNRSVFPKFVVDEADRMKNLLLSQGILFAGGAAAVLFFLLVGEEFIALTFGSSYIEAAGFGPHYMVMISAVSAVALLSNYCISVDIEKVKVVALMPFLQLLLIAFFHSTVLEIIYSTLAAASLTAFILAVFVSRSRN